MALVHIGPNVFWRQNQSTLLFFLLLFIFAQVDSENQPVKLKRETRTGFAGCRSSEAVPVILFSKGRSGSTGTWLTIAALMGGGPNALEYTGSNPKQQAIFYKTHKTSEWLPMLLCRQQAHYKKGIVGTKWKTPFKVQLHERAINASLEYLRDHPQIKVVRLVRNPLDVLVSRAKHHSKDVPSMCQRGDAACLELHRKASAGINLSVHDLFEKLEHDTQQDQAFHSLLHSMRIPHVDVTYEELYFSDSAAGWQRILSFLGRPHPNLTMNVVKKKIKTAFTSSRSLNSTLANYEEVQRLLSGTRFEKLLH